MSSCLDCGAPVLEAEPRCPACRTIDHSSVTPKAVVCAICDEVAVDAVLSRTKRETVCGACLVEEDASDPTTQLLGAFFRQRPPQTVQTGDLHAYEFGPVIGEGGMGVVYRAQRRSDGEQVAVKILRPDVTATPEARQLFLREVASLRNVSAHPHCVRLLGEGQTGHRDQGVLYLVMEYCAGGNLLDLLERHGGPLDPGAVLPLASQALDGLAYFHEQNMVHRDLKPANVLLTAAEGGTVKIADLGLAKRFEDAGCSNAISITGGISGTPDYMPREQTYDSKHARPVSDVWSMGATIYHLLTGRSPRQLPNSRHLIQLVAAIRNTPPIPIRDVRPSLGRELASVLDRALSDDLGARYKDAGEFKLALEGVL